MSKCLTCVHFKFSFAETHIWSEVTVDYGHFHIICMEQHFNRDSEETDEVELHNLLMSSHNPKRHYACEDYRRSEKICTGCGKRGHEYNVWCPHCQEPFNKKAEEEVTC